MNRIKKGLIILLVLLIVSGCSSRNREKEQPVSAQSEQTSSENTESAIEQQLEEAISELPAVVGSYVFEVKGVEPQNYPTLQINGDGSFRFTANLLNYLGHFEGTCTVEDMVLTLEVDSVDFDGFTADKVKTIYFEVAAGSDLIYTGNDSAEQAIGVTNPYDLFKRQKKNSGASSGEAEESGQQTTLSLVSNTSQGEKAVDDPAMVEQILSMLAEREPLADTDDKIEKREGNPSISLMVYHTDGSEQWIIFPGTPESLGEEVTVLFGGAGQFAAGLDLFETLNGMLLS